MHSSRGLWYEHQADLAFSASQGGYKCLRILRIRIEPRCGVAFQIEKKTNKQISDGENRQTRSHLWYYGWNSTQCAPSDEYWNSRTGTFLLKNITYFVIVFFCFPAQRVGGFLVYPRHEEVWTNLWPYVRLFFPSPLKVFALCHAGDARQNHHTRKQVENKTHIKNKTAGVRFIDDFYGNKTLFFVLLTCFYE